MQDIENATNLDESLSNGECFIDRIYHLGLFHAGCIDIKLGRFLAKLGQFQLIKLFAADRRYVFALLALNSATALSVILVATVLLVAIVLLILMTRIRVV